MSRHETFLRLDLCLTCISLAAGCANKEGAGDANLSPDVLAAAATATCNAWLTVRGASEMPPGADVPPSCWAAEIKALHPLRVYLHRLNVVVVQAASADREEGKYISVLISSYAPHSGDDGFTFTGGNGYVYDFKRDLRSRSRGLGQKNDR
jgi:hypothetical protein